MTFLGLKDAGCPVQSMTALPVPLFQVLVGSFCKTEDKGACAILVTSQVPKEIKPDA